MLKAEKVSILHTWESGNSGPWWNMPLRVVALVSRFSKTFCQDWTRQGWIWEFKEADLIRKSSGQHK